MDLLHLPLRRGGVPYEITPLWREHKIGKNNKNSENLIEIILKHFRAAKFNFWMQKINKKRTFSEL